MVTQNRKSIKGYRILEKIDEGGFGLVYRALQVMSSFEREVALKVIKPEMANQPDFIRRFETEAHLVARLEHPHIVPLINYWRDPDGAYLVMRYLKGGSLRDVIIKEGALEPKVILAIMEQIARALDLAHRNNVIHRDIKPGNILLDEDGYAYLTDFGIAKNLSIASENGQTDPEAVVGSLDYIAPEQARSEAVTARTDIYSLGVTMYEMLTGEHPFKESNRIERLFKHMNEPLPDMMNLNDELRDGLNNVIQKATAKDPAKRYTEVLEFAGAFREVVRSGETTEEAIAGGDITLRQIEVLSLLAMNMNNKEIARELIVTVGNIRYHLRNIYRKLGVRNRTEAVLKARFMGLIPWGDNEHADLQAPDERILPTPENPYKGLRPFEKGDTRDFFGRDSAVKKMIAQFSDGSRFERFLAIVGPSGSGKSSLVRAGFIPALWEGQIPGAEKWLIADMLPRQHPLAELETALMSVAADQGQNLQTILARDEFGLVRASNLILPQENAGLVLLIDQFEELFTLTLDEDERTHFLNLLVNAITDERSRIRVVITLRADYYDKPLHYAEFGEILRNRLITILPLSVINMEQAIIGPAQRVGVKFEAGLVSQIIDDMSYQAGALPLLQYALTELFDRREDHLITQQAYHDIGGAVKALANRADELYLSMPHHAQDITQQIFLRLVTPGDGAEDTRRRTPLDEIFSLSDDEDLIDEIIQAFTDYRLLTQGHDDSSHQPVIEVAHEAILREWERLREWINASRDDLRMQAVVARLSDEWLKANRDNSFLAHGTHLSQLLEWQEATPLKLTSDEETFLQKSKEEHIRLDQEEQARQQEEARLIKRSQRLQQVVIIILLFVALGSIAMTSFALDREAKARNAQAQSDLNASIADDRAREARQLAIVNGVYTALANDDRPLAIELGLIAATDDTFNPFAQQALARATYPPGPVATLKDDMLHSVTLDISADGRTLLHAYSGEDRGWEIALWNVDRESVDFGTIIRSYDNYDTGLHTAYFNPDATQFIAVQHDSRIFLQDVATGDVISELIPPDPVIVTIGVLRFSPDGRFAVSNDSTRNLYIWDVDQNSPTFGTVIHHWTGDEEGHQSFLWQPYYNHNGDRIISVSSDQTAILWDATDGTILHHFTGHDTPITVAAISPDDKRLATASTDGIIIVWNIDEDAPDFGQEIRQLVGHNDTLFQMDFAPDGKSLLSGGWDGRLIYWNTDEGQRTSIEGDFQGGASQYGTVQSSFDMQNIQGVAITPDGHYGFAAYHQLIMWDLYNDRQIGHWTWAKTALGTAYTPDGDYAVFATNRGFRMVDSATGDVLWQVDDAFENMVMDLAINRDGTRLAVAGDDGRLLVWDIDPDSVTYQQIVHTLIEGDYAYADVFFGTEGRYLYTTGMYDGSLHQWDMTKGDLSRIYRLPPDFIRTIIPHPDGHTIAMQWALPRFMGGMGEQNDIVLYDLATGTVTAHFEGNTPLAFSPDGSQLLISQDNSAILLDIADRTRLREFTGDLVINQAVFAPDGLSIVTADNSGTVTQWDRQSGTILQQFEASDEGIISLAIHPQAESILTMAFTEAHLWRLDSLPQLVNRALTQREYRYLNCTERDIYQLEPSCDDDGNLPETIITPPEIEPINLIAIPEPDEVTFTLEQVSLPDPQVISAGTYMGEVRAGDRDLWFYDGTSGETLTISVNADQAHADRSYYALLADDPANPPQEVTAAFDPITWVTMPENGRVITLIPHPDTTVINYFRMEGMDNFGDSTNVRIENLVLPANGLYQISISGFAYATGGTYTLTIESE